MENFERVATDMYEAFKMKENEEETLQQLIQSKKKITSIRQQSTYIQSINARIDKLQGKVQDARMHMEMKRETLTKAHIEMKKMETIISNRKEKQIALEKKMDMNMMDEIALQQYLSLK